MGRGLKETRAGLVGGRHARRQRLEADRVSAWMGHVRMTTSARCAMRGVVLAVGVAMTGAVGVDPASAGTYVMRNCNVPGHGNSLMAPWAPHEPDPGVSIIDGCATGGGIAFTLNELQQLPWKGDGLMLIRRPPPPRNDISFVKVVLWYAARLAGSGHPLGFWSHGVTLDGSPVAGISNSPPGSELLVAEQRFPPNTDYYMLGLTCASGVVGEPGPCLAASRVPLLIRGMEFTLSEDIPPIVLSPTGSLVQGGTQAGMGTLHVTASDVQSGLSKVDVLLDETTIASRDLTARCHYSDFTVCPTSLDESFQIDTRAIPNGTYRLTVRVTDAAGNPRDVHSESTVVVGNQPAPNETAPIVSDATAYTLTARFKGTSRPTLTVSYGRPSSVTGRLAGGSKPVAEGTLVDVLEKRDRPGAREVLRGRVKTKIDGSFSTVLVTTRSSRRVRLAYRPAAGSQVVSRTLRLRVRAASRLRASLRGRVIRFSGRVLSGPIAKVGKKVVMEGRSPGSAWTAFKHLRTDRRGRFSGTYRLRVRRPGVALKIRALVPIEGGYGYLSARSRAVTLRVR